MKKIIFLVTSMFLCIVPVIVKADTITVNEDSYIQINKIYTSNGNTVINPYLQINDQVTNFYVILRSNNETYDYIDNNFILHRNIDEYGNTLIETKIEIIDFDSNNLFQVKNNDQFTYSQNLIVDYTLEIDNSKQDIPTLWYNVFSLYNDPLKNIFFYGLNISVIMILLKIKGLKK